VLRARTYLRARSLSLVAGAKPSHDLARAHPPRRPVRIRPVDAALLDERIAALIAARRPELERLVDRAIDAQLELLVADRLTARNGHSTEDPPAGDGGRSRLRGEVRATEALGSEVLVHLAVSAEPVLTEEVREVAVDVDAAALEQLESEALAQRTIIIGRFETSERLRTGEEIEVAVDSRKLHFFDLETGLAIYGT
jgi:hypothetical protein